ncbi:unnamed protein product [Arabis nemorensis]|uniref:Uncharacterized protein n=1 Tax=Arabis nemorensis TaxID=586526 RepID=A0A565BIQ6_9BRAS|nr:unnamed protein product [Arabis nemorensis]
MNQDEIQGLWDIESNNIPYGFNPSQVCAALVRFLRSMGFYGNFSIEGVVANLEPYHLTPFRQAALQRSGIPVEVLHTRK